MPSSSLQTKPKPPSSRTPNGWRCCSIARRPIATPGAFKSRLRSAKLRHSQAAIEDVDYRTPRRLDKALFQQLTAGKWNRRAPQFCS